MSPFVYVALGLAFAGVLVLVATIVYWLTSRVRTSDGTEVMPFSDSRDG
jgi:hypothetical protein